MRKRSNRRVRNVAMPTLVFMHTIPDAEIATFTALDAFREGYASPGQFDILLDTRDLLLLAASAQKDEGVIAVCSAANIALGQIRDSWDGERFAPLTTDELNALAVLVDISNDWWRRKSGTLYQAAFTALKEWRVKQGEMLNEDRRQENRTDETGLVCS
ncbi:hypothetical protein UFOVP653_35 [uncultured Caudovirales phage]|uniref:Uncharacterized protein n=1 Tax=uncultured Caudovirales phage TaxID=2100421 RepID=A0A6J5NCF2_9CAUD|nr:hypothetical protein UFOVP653_35 [uncultured Caudovirales phage]